MSPIYKMVVAIYLGWFAIAAQAAVPVAGLPDFAGLVESSGPVVVNISTTQNIKRSTFPGLEAPDAHGGKRFDDLLRRYFGDEGPPEFFDSKSLGSGFVISPDGYILTCAHVVENAKEIVVKFNDRREFVAKLIGSDRRSDVALLKINAKNLPAATIGDPEKLKVGDWVLAIGSPFGFESSATAGIVSAKGRNLPRENYVPFIQTDVAINPGNSGGPLFNLKGEVVGINSQIYSRTGGFMGLSFAVPINMAMQISKQLQDGGRVKRGWLGVLIQDVTRELADSFSMKKPHGALIADIVSDGPAAKTALKVGDVVVEFNGQRIESSSELPPLVGQTAPGASAKLVVLRAGQTKTINVTIGQLPEENVAARGRDSKSNENEKHDQLGLALSELTTQQRKQFGVEEGVLVERVGEGPGQRAGIRPGDVIQQVDGKPVKNVAALRAQIAVAPKDRSLPILVRRGSGALFLALKVLE
jgi:serine protease Do